jgi:hypothetical protein
VAVRHDLQGTGIDHRGVGLAGHILRAAVERGDLRIAAARYDLDAGGPDDRAYRNAVDDLLAAAADDVVLVETGDAFLAA